MSGRTRAQAEWIINKVLQGTYGSYLDAGSVEVTGSNEGNDSMDADPETATEDGYITVTIDGTTYQIPAYSLT